MINIRTIEDLYNTLKGNYEDGGYVSRAAIFNRALNEGIITEDTYNKAREYYGSLWNYVGD